MSFYSDDCEGLSEHLLALRWGEFEEFCSHLIDQMDDLCSPDGLEANGHDAALALHKCARMFLHAREQEKIAAQQSDESI